MVEKTVLDNGLTILSDSNPYVKSVTLSFYVKVGSHNEVGFPKGIAHFLEHMMFKGTAKRSASDISEQIDGMGAVANAYTSAEVTKYYCMSRFDRWEKTLDLLSDILWNSTFPLQEIEKERLVILEEIKMYNDDPTAALFRNMNQFMNTNNPNRHDPLGTVEGVKRISQAELKDFVGKYYTPNNIVFVATGNVDHAALVKFFESYPYTRSGQATVPNDTFTPTDYDTQTMSYERDIEQAHLGFALYGPKRSSQDSAAIKVLMHLLGGSMSSRLFKIIREEMGLAYHVEATYSGYTDVGHISGYVGLDKSNIEAAKKVVTEQLVRLKTELVTESELKRTIEHILGLTMMGMEKTSTVNEFIGKNYISGSSLDIDTHIQKVESVTAEDIMRVANTYIDENKILFGQVVPKS